MAHILHQDFLRAKNAYLKARSQNNKKVYVSLYKTMLKIHDKLVALGE